MFVPISTAQATDTSAKSTHEAWMMRRLSKRSAMWPKGIAPSRNGTQWLIVAKPASTGDWNFCHMTK